jgi:Alpha/beta hydrolase domain
MQNPTRTPVGGFNCAVPINTGGTHWALDAAIYWLKRWIVTGTPPPRAPLLETTHVSPVVYKVDANGNVIGGVRTPQVDAPIAALGSQGNSGGFCVLFGSTVPYSAAHLASLYKTHGQFVAAWARAVRSDRADGFLLPADAAELLHSAVVSDVPRHGG